LNFAKFVERCVKRPSFRIAGKDSQNWNRTG